MNEPFPRRVMDRNLEGTTLESAVVRLDRVHTCAVEGRTVQDHHEGPGSRTRNGIAQPQGAVDDGHRRLAHLFWSPFTIGGGCRSDPVLDRHHMDLWTRIFGSYSKGIDVPAHIARIDRGREADRNGG